MNATTVASGTKAVPAVVSSIQDIPLTKIRESKTNGPCVLILEIRNASNPNLRRFSVSSVHAPASSCQVVE